jgi:replicative DNA helicase
VRSAQDYQELGPVLVRVVENVDELHSTPPTDGIVGTPTGFIDLDRMLNGIQGGQLIIVAARPAVGKTSFAMNIAENVAINEGLPVAAHSMEMSADELMLRSVGSVGRIDQGRLKTGRLVDEDWAKLTVAVQKLNEAQIFIDDSASQMVSEIRAKARRLHRQHGKLGAIVVDYVQLIQGSNPRENRVAQVSEISRMLKMLAKELDVPVIALSQLNRGLEQRPNKRPILADLRESGAIEQDADIVIALYRDELYNLDSTDKGTAEAIVLKNRAGSTGMVRLAWRGECTRFDNFIGAQGAYSH